MSRQNALNIVLSSNNSTKDQLAEIYGAVIDNVEKTAVSSAIKNTMLSGDPTSGSVEAKRFENATSNAYGTARTAGNGVAVKSTPVTVKIDTDKEIVEELQEKDIELYGIPDLIAKRASNHASAMVRELDTAFFTEAYHTGTAFTSTSSDINNKIEDLIASVEATKNNFVDGVPRDQIALVLSVATHSALRKQIDALPSGVDIANGIVGVFHGCDVYVSNRLPSATNQVVDAFAMTYGAVAQQAMANEYTDEKIPFSNAHAVELFYSYGTKAVSADLIQYLGNAYSA